MRANQSGQGPMNVVPVIRQIEIDKDMVLFPPVAIVRLGRIHEDASLLAIRLAEKNKPVMILPGSRPQQDRVHYPEHRGICADAQTERQHHQRCEAGIPNCQAQPVAKVLQQHRLRCDDYLGAGIVR